MKERIIEFLRTENKTSSQFADEIGVQPSSISHIISGRNNPSLDFVYKMLSRYTSLNPDWLLLGKGGMYRVDNEKIEFGTKFEDRKENIPREALLFSNAEPSKAINPNQADNLSNIDKTVARDATGDRKTIKIAVFYSDNSFEEYLPT